jgi:hypothetical protein
MFEGCESNKGIVVTSNLRPLDPSSSFLHLPIIMTHVHIDHHRVSLYLVVSYTYFLDFC